MVSKKREERASSQNVNKKRNEESCKTLENLNFQGFSVYVACWSSVRLYAIVL